MCYMYLNDEVGSKKQNRIDDKEFLYNFKLRLNVPRYSDSKTALSRYRKLVYI